jgi:hypothetical protein
LPNVKSCKAINRHIMEAMKFDMTNEIKYHFLFEKSEELNKAKMGIIKNDNLFSNFNRPVFKFSEYKSPKTYRK